MGGTGQEADPLEHCDTRCGTKDTENTLNK